MLKQTYNLQLMSFPALYSWIAYGHVMLLKKWEGLPLSSWEPRQILELELSYPIRKEDPDRELLLQASRESTQLVDSSFILY